MPDFEMTPGSDETIGRIDTPYHDPDDFAERPPPPAREGLPKAFRMRHASHYVEQLMGDGPLQTVRQISLDQIDRMDDEPVADDLSGLVASIREVGVLQPLLIAARDASRFDLVAGRKRLSAARAAGLAAVPCLLVHADVEAARKLRAHAEWRPAPPEVTPEIAPPVDTASDGVMRTAFSEISTSMRFINALAPIARTNDSPSRVAMIVGAISMEASRATTVAAAAELLMRTEPLRLAPVDCVALIDTIRAQVAPEARLKGVHVEWKQSLDLATTVADRDALATGWSALIHALLGPAREGHHLEVSLIAPRVRPAIILEATLHGAPIQGDMERFFDEHPAGRAGAIMLAAARQSAKLHGGRLSVNAIEDGIAAAFVAPQPLDLI